MLLLLDGHSTHFTPEAIQASKKHGIEVIALPPHTTHQAQPLDVSFFKSLKSHWSNVCHEYMSENVGHVVTKFQFSALFSKAWYLAIKPETIINGFRKTGVYPLNKHAISSPSLSCDSGSPTNHDSFTKSQLMSDETSPTNKFSSSQLTCFQKRYDNGFDVFTDIDYVRWLKLYHPDSLPDDVEDSSELDSNNLQIEVPLGDHGDDTSSPGIVAETDEEIPHQTPLSSSPVGNLTTLLPTPVSPINDKISTCHSCTSQMSDSLSKSLQNTRKAYSAISEFLEMPSGSVVFKKTTKSHQRSKGIDQ